MTQYAANTTVSVEKTRMEIEQTLRRYKAETFAYSTEGRRAAIQFRISGRVVRFILELPNPYDKAFTHHSRGIRTYVAADRLWEQACRQRWRALALLIKAKLEAVAAGITTIEDEFLAHTLLPDGSLVGRWMQPQVDEAYRVGSMPTALLLEGPRE